MVDSKQRLVNARHGQQTMELGQSTEKKVDVKRRRNQMGDRVKKMKDPNDNVLEPNGNVLELTSDLEHKQEKAKRTRKDHLECKDQHLQVQTSENWHEKEICAH
ncbi:hypothetical protein U1Q18_045892 [Sarracenia purpurea var. burkii]